ncbi:MAG TPA: NifB/NifX family molybdenum-iron cluster-binding protein [Candidatus Limnocylindrales bacterium]|nr:NifB/NifX family molybdenum-iron cluster-binding protein [Candidatus Limnocylindrales bacterium]
MKVCVTLLPDGTAGGGFGRAPRVGVATVEEGSVTAWEEHEVRWDELHDEGTEGAHHARIARFLLDNGVGAVAAGHIGPPMQHQLGKMGISFLLGADGDPRDVAMVAASPR